MNIGDKVKVKQKYLLEIAKKDLESAKFLARNVGKIVGFDDITWYFTVKFKDKEFSFRRLHLERVDE